MDPNSGRVERGDKNDWWRFKGNQMISFMDRVELRFFGMVDLKDLEDVFGKTKDGFGFREVKRSLR